MSERRVARVALSFAKQEFSPSHIVYKKHVSFVSNNAFQSIDEGREKTYTDENFRVGEPAVREIVVLFDIDRQHLSR